MRSGLRGLFFSGLLPALAYRRKSASQVLGSLVIALDQIDKRQTRLC